MSNTIKIGDKVRVTNKKPYTVIGKNGVVVDIMAHEGTETLYDVEVQTAIGLGIYSYYRKELVKPKQP